jgi:hypothetical protein
MRRTVVLLMFSVIAGCGGPSDKPQLAPVSGVVMMNDKPLADVTVAFHLDAQEAPRAGIGKTDANGKFRITTYDTNDGAIVGTHIVTVAKIDAGPNAGGDMEIGGDAYGAAMLAAANPNAPPPKQLFPEKFASKDTSPLRVTVEAGGKDDVKILLE